MSRFAFSRRSGGIEGRPPAAYMRSKIGDSSTSAESASRLMMRRGWSVGMRASRSTKASMLSGGSHRPRIGTSSSLIGGRAGHLRTRTTARSRLAVDNGGGGCTLGGIGVRRFGFGGGSQMAVDDAATDAPGRLVRANDLDIYYEEYGAGPPLVDIHAGTSSILHRPAFGAHFRVVAPNTRGHGRTANPTGAMSYGLLADDV